MEKHWGSEWKDENLFSWECWLLLFFLFIQTSSLADHSPYSSLKPATTRSLLASHLTFPGPTSPSLCLHMPPRLGGAGSLFSFC